MRDSGRLGYLIVVGGRVNPDKVIPDLADASVSGSASEVLAPLTLELELPSQAC